MLREVLHAMSFPKLPSSYRDRKLKLTVELWFFNARPFLFISRNCDTTATMIKRARSLDSRRHARARLSQLHSYAPCTRRRRGVRSTQIFPTWRQSQFISHAPIRREIRARRDRLRRLRRARNAIFRFSRRVRIGNATAYWTRLRALCTTPATIFSSPMHVAPPNLIFSSTFLFPAFRLPKSYKSDTADGRWQSTLHVRYERARTQRLGDLRKFPCYFSYIFHI